MKLAAILAIALVACTPAPLPPSPDASDAAPNPNTPQYQRACATLAALGCAEGVDAQCAVVLERAATAHITTFDLPCLTAATSKAAVRACGQHNVSCAP